MTPREMLCAGRTTTVALRLGLARRRSADGIGHAIGRHSSVDGYSCSSLLSAVAAVCFVLVLLKFRSYLPGSDD